MSDQDRINGAWQAAVGILRIAGLLAEGWRLELRNDKGEIVASFANVQEVKG